MARVARVRLVILDPNARPGLIEIARLAIAREAGPRKLARSRSSRQQVAHQPVPPRAP